MRGVDVSGGIMVNETVGVIGDRTYAISREEGLYSSNWRHKREFFVCMNHEGMTAVEGCRENELDENFDLSVSRAKELYTSLGLPEKPSSLVVALGESGMCDSPKPYVSFLNLASVRDLEKRTGLSIDPRRFRMNVWVEGLDPWVELSYVKSFAERAKYKTHVNHLMFEIEDLCERCRAIDQHPETGRWDMSLLKELVNYLKSIGYGGSPHRGTYNVMGWLAITPSEGRIRAGDQVLFG